MSERDSMKPSNEPPWNVSDSVSAYFNLPSNEAADLLCCFILNQEQRETFGTFLTEYDCEQKIADHQRLDYL